MRDWHVPASHAVDVLQFSRTTRTVRLDANESAMRLDVRVRPLLEPAQRIRSTSDVGKRALHPRIFPEPFVEAFSKSAQSQRVAQNQDVDAFRRGGRLEGDGLHFAHGLRLLCKQAAPEERQSNQQGEDFHVRDTEHGNRFPANPRSRQASRSGGLKLPTKTT